jgi:hypothetical protein
MKKDGTRDRSASAQTLRIEEVTASDGADAATRGPCYDAERRELRFEGEVVKCFMQESDAQEVILMAFEEERWPRSIDDPLPVKEGQDRKQRLRMAVANLNRRQRVPLLHFSVVRQGTGVAWELRDAREGGTTAEETRRLPFRKGDPATG